MPPVRKKIRRRRNKHSYLKMEHYPSATDEQEKEEKKVAKEGEQVEQMKDPDVPPEDGRPKQPNLKEIAKIVNESHEARAKVLMEVSKLSSVGGNKRVITHKLLLVVNSLNDICRNVMMDSLALAMRISDGAVKDMLHQLHIQAIENTLIAKQLVTRDELDEQGQIIGQAIQREQEDAMARQQAAGQNHEEENPPVVPAPRCNRCSQCDDMCRCQLAEEQRVDDWHQANSSPGWCPLRQQQLEEETLEEETVNESEEQSDSGESCLSEAPEQNSESVPTE